MSRLSGMQRGLWLAEKAGGTQHTVRCAIRLTGRLDLAALSGAVTHLAARHDALRCQISGPENEPCWVVAKEVCPPLRQIDLQQADAASLEPVLQQLATQHFDLAAAPLVRIGLIRIGERSATLWINAHHLIVDETSMEVLCSELFTLYQGRVLPDEAASFIGYLAWLETWRGSAQAQRARAFWRDRLAGLGCNAGPDASQRHSGLAAMATATDSTVHRALSRQDLQCVEELCREFRCTRFIVLLGALQLLLWRHSGAATPPICTPVQLRPEEDDRALVGSCLSVMIVRSHCRGDDSLVQLFATLQEHVYAAWNHRGVSLTEALDLSGCSPECRGQVPRFWFALQRELAMLHPGVCAELQVEHCRVANPIPGAHLVLLARQGRQGWELVAEFNRTMLPALLVDTLLSQYLSLIRGLGAVRQWRLGEILRTIRPAPGPPVSAALIQRGPPLAAAAGLEPACRPQSALEIDVARAWAEVVGHTVDDLDMNFFDAGGTSVLVPLLSGLLRELGLEASIKGIYRYPTVRQQALAFATAPPVALQ